MSWSAGSLALPTGLMGQLFGGLRDKLPGGGLREPVEDAAARLAAIRGRRGTLAPMTDLKIRELAQELRRRVGEREPLAFLEEEAFALAAEASRRTLGFDPYDEQLLAGLALHEGKVIEMKTGEGKTLAAVAPIFLNALTGLGVHVLTFNDYLARRDAAWMGPAYEMLGISVGVVQEGMEPPERRSAYGKDVTYLTAKEAGFDLLRDQLALDASEQVHRPFHLALVDEADSILIDEARIPLVIAGEVDSPEGSHSLLAELMGGLDEGSHYATDEHRRNVYLTDDGCRALEEGLGHPGLFEGGDTGMLAAVQSALHAEVLLHRNVDYVVRKGADGETVELVDELTGRVAENRRWPDGLQAAVEAKERLCLRAEGRILGSISLQHFLGLYPRLAGMTGTALPAAEELAELYDVETVSIPTHRPNARVDHPDFVYANREAKHRALVAEITRVHGSGRPILVGTLTVEESEALAGKLRQAGVPCKVLNAKNDDEEAAIVAEAGALGAVTISTNMAGRGTDVRLGGSGGEERDEVVALGGLYVIGTNRHESRRIDDQLRGRAGRQGDPGSTRFFLSLEDDLLVRFGIRSLIPEALFPKGGDEPIDHPVILKEIDRTQRIMEGECFDARRRLWQYSNRLEQQRRLVTGWRQDVLVGEAPAGLFEARSPERWAAWVEAAGEEEAQALEHRLTLLAIDACWSEHLAEMTAVKDELHFVALDGRQPLAEFCRIAGEACEAFLGCIDTQAVELFEALPLSQDGIDWQAQGLQGPSATWTYLVHDGALAPNTFLTLATRPSLFLGAFALWPLFFVLALGRHVARWRRRHPSLTG